MSRHYQTGCYLTTVFRVARGRYSGGRSFLRRVAQVWMRLARMGGVSGQYTAATCRWYAQQIWVGMRTHRI